MTFSKENKYELLVNTMSEGLMILDEFGNFLECNPACLELFSTNIDEIKKFNVKDSRWHLVNEKGQKLGLEEYPSQIVMKTKQPVLGKVLGLVKANNKITWLRTNAHPIQVEKKWQVFITFTDVSEHKERELHEKLLFSVLNNLPNMVFVKDFQNGLRFKLFNKAGEELLGFKSQDLIGKNDYDFFPKEQADFFTDKDKEVFRNKTLTKIDKEPIDTPKGKRWLRTYKVPTFHFDGTPNMLIGISTDITEELEVQKELEEQRAKVIHNAKLASLGEMSAGIAHEINNPLSVIMGATSLIKKYASDPEKLQSKIDSIMKASSRIEKIVSGLKKFARTSEGVPHKVMNLKELVQEAMIFVESKANRTETTLKTEVEDNLSILCDSAEIQQVIVNLINNAIDAIKNLEEKCIQIKAFEDKNEVVIQVIDSGISISKELEQKIFQPFFTTKEVGEGTGLGLSISKGIIEQHNGTLVLNRNCPQTCFEIRLPKAI